MRRIPLFLLALLLIAGCNKPEPPPVTPEPPPEPEIIKPAIPEPKPEPQPAPNVKTPEPPLEPQPSKTVTPPIPPPPPPSPQPSAPESAIDTNFLQMVRSRQENQVVKSHGLLFHQLNLSEDDENKLRDLLVDQSLEMMNQASPEADPEKHVGLKEINDGIKDLLGDRYADYQAFQDTKLERLLTGGIPLEDEKKADLVRALHEVRRNHAFTRSYAAGAGAENYQDEAIAQHLKETEALQTRLSEKAATLLGPEELAQFQQMQERWKRVEEMRIRRDAEKHATPAP